MKHFIAALREIEPSALREVFVEVPDVRWEDVGGLDDVKQTLREIVEWPVQHGELLRHARVRPPRGVLLQGPPGTGKTLLVKAVAREAGSNFISIKGPELLSKYVGESERGIRDVFKKARQAAPCIVFFDEIDAIAPRRGSSGDGHVTERVVAQILAEMDGVEELSGVLVLAATNRVDMLDPALLRPGRFDYLIEIGPPDEAARLAILKVHTRDRPMGRDVDLVELARLTKGLNGADIQKLIGDAAMLAVRERIAHRLHEVHTPFEIRASHIARSHAAARGREIAGLASRDGLRAEE